MEYSENPHAIYMREWRRAHPEEAAAARRRSREAHPEYYREVSRAWRQANHEKRLAHKCVRRAVLAGRLVRPATCEHCEAEGAVFAHHADYTRPLDVVWLCLGCHAKVHQP